MSAAGEIQFYVDLLFEASADGAELKALEKVPEHLIPQVLEQYALQQQQLQDPKFLDEKFKEKYEDDDEYGIEEIKRKELEQADGLNPLKLTEIQDLPYLQGLDMEEHDAFYEELAEEIREDLNQFRRTTASANQTDILPHLFKKQRFYEAIQDKLDKTIVTAKEGRSQYYFLTRTKKEASGSIFRETAELPNTEAELLPRDLTRTGVIERKVENFNPFKGKFTFRTTYGPPPTSSLSASAASASVIFDLGVTELGPTYTVNNVTTGSLHSSSFFSCARALSINDTVVGIGEFFVTTQSIIDVRVGIPGTVPEGLTTSVKYIARWEQNFTSQSVSALTIPYQYVRKRYKPSVTNANLNQLFPTKKTVLKNGNIFIT